MIVGEVVVGKEVAGGWMREWILGEGMDEVTAGRGNGGLRGAQAMG